MTKISFIPHPLDSEAIKNFHKIKNLFWCSVRKDSFNLFFAFMHEMPGSMNPFVKPSDWTHEGATEGIRRNGIRKIQETGGVKPDGSTEQ